MSLLKSIKQQLGLGPAAESHFWDGSVANQLSLKRGTPDAPGTTVMSVVNGQVAFPNNTGPAFQAVPSSTQTLTSGVSTKVLFGLESFDYGNGYDAPNSKFQPTIAGLYQITALVNGTVNAGATTMAASLAKNGNGGSPIAWADNVSNNTNSLCTLSALVSMNGTTDYLEVFTAITGTNPYISSTSTNFSGVLVRPA